MLKLPSVLIYVCWTDTAVLMCKVCSTHAVQIVKVSSNGVTACATVFKQHLLQSYIMCMRLITILSDFQVAAPAHPAA